MPTANKFRQLLDLVTHLGDAALYLPACAYWEKRHTILQVGQHGGQLALPPTTAIKGTRGAVPVTAEPPSALTPRNSTSGYTADR